MSIWAPTESPPAVAPVLLLTLGLATLSLSWALGRVLVVTLLSCVSAAEGAMALPWCEAGSLPSLRRMLRLAGGKPLAEVRGEEEVGESEGGILNLPPRRRRVVGAGAFVANLSAIAFFWEGGGFLRTPAYWRMDPSSSLSSKSTFTFTFPAAFPAAVLIPTSTPLSRRLKTPVGWQTTALWVQDFSTASPNVVTFIYIYIKKKKKSDLNGDSSHLGGACGCVRLWFCTKSLKDRCSFHAFKKNTGQLESWTATS